MGDTEKTSGANDLPEVSVMHEYPNFKNEEEILDHEILGKDLGLKWSFPFSLNIACTTKTNSSKQKNRFRCLVEGLSEDEEKAEILIDRTTACANIIVQGIPVNTSISPIGPVKSFDHRFEDEEEKSQRVNIVEKPGFKIEQDDNRDISNFLDIAVAPFSFDLESRIGKHYSHSTSSFPNARREEKQDTSTRVSYADREAILQIIQRLYFTEEYGIIDMEKAKDCMMRKLIPEEPLPCRHPNFMPLYSIAESATALYLIIGSAPYSLESLIKFNYHTLRRNDIDDTLSNTRVHSILPRHDSMVTKKELPVSVSSPPCLKLDHSDKILDDISDVVLRFLQFQMLQVIRYLHSQGINHGSLSTTSIHVSNNLWVLFDLGEVISSRVSSKTEKDNITNVSKPAAFAPKLPLYSFVRRSLTERWRHGEVSNLDYLMAVNGAAGRRMGDAKFHPIIPWITDFSHPNPKGRLQWRDLSQSKFRLAKGEKQLETTFLSSAAPHHITESLSEITYYIYMARVVPLTTLKAVVRSNFEAKEYPASMARMYEWTPDECIPEFFTDPTVFKSVHEDIDMSDIELPPWCNGSPEAFISWHRDMLESDYVSQHLHSWIDLNFGISLSGEEAVHAMNVTLPLESLPSHRLRKSPGFVQVFTEHHPERMVSENSSREALIDYEFKKADDRDLLGRINTIESSNTFAYNFAHLLSPVYYPDRSRRATPELGDMFAIGCIFAEMYLRQPLLSEEIIKVLEHNIDTCIGNDAVSENFNSYCGGILRSRLSKLPPRMRALVTDLLCLRFSADEILSGKSQYKFPDFFEPVYRFLSKYHSQRNWVQRLDFYRTHLNHLLSVEIKPRDIDLVVELLLPSALELSNCRCIKTRSRASVVLIDLFGQFAETQEKLLPVAVQVYEQMVLMEQWESLGFLIQKKSIMIILKWCGIPMFVRNILPILLDVMNISDGNIGKITKTSLLEREMLRTKACEIIVELSQPQILGASTSVRSLLPPLLHKWKAKTQTRKGYEKEFHCARLDMWLVEMKQKKSTSLYASAADVCASQGKVTNLIKFLCKAAKDPTLNISSTLSSTSILSKAFVGVVKNCGPSAIMHKVLPSILDVVSLLWEQKGPIKAESSLIDAFNIITNMVPVLSASSLVDEFFSSKTKLKVTIRDMLLQAPLGTQNESNVPGLFHIHLAILFIVMCVRISRDGDGSLPGEVFKTVNDFLSKVVDYVVNDARNKGSSTSVIIAAEIFYLPLKALIGESKLRRAIPDIPDQFLLRVTNEFEVRNDISDEVHQPKKKMDESESLRMNSNFVLETLMRNINNKGDHYNAGSSSYNSDFAWVLDEQKSDAPWKQLVIHNFSAHRSGIATMEIDQYERYMMTSSKGGTVKVWNLAASPREVAHVTSNTANSTYSRTSNVVNSIRLIDGGSRAILLDGTLRVWDVQHEKHVTVQVPRSGKSLLCIESSPPQVAGGASGGAVMWAASAAGTLSCIDLRERVPIVATYNLPGGLWSGSGTSSSLHVKNHHLPLPTCALTIGGSRSMGWVAAARTSGHVSMLEPRTGCILGHWLAHPGGIGNTGVATVAIKALSLPLNGVGYINSAAKNVHNEHHLLTVGSNGIAKVWDVSMSDVDEETNMGSISGSRPWVGLRLPSCPLKLTGLPMSSRSQQIVVGVTKQGAGQGVHLQHLNANSGSVNSTSKMSSSGSTQNTSAANISSSYMNKVDGTQAGANTLAPTVSLSGTPLKSTDTKGIKGLSSTPMKSDPENKISNVGSGLEVSSLPQQYQYRDGDKSVVKMPESHSKAQPPVRVQLNVPMCDCIAVDLNRQSGMSTLYVAGGCHISVSPMILSTSTNTVDRTVVSNQDYSLVDYTTGTPYKRDRLQINSLRRLPLRKLVLAGTESGSVYACI